MPGVMSKKLVCMLTWAVWDVTYAEIGKQASNVHTPIYSNLSPFWSTNSSPQIVVKRLAFGTADDPMYDSP